MPITTLKPDAWGRGFGAVANDGLKAVSIYRDQLEKGDPFDAVILDIYVKNGMGAGETLRLPSEPYSLSFRNGYTFPPLSPYLSRIDILLRSFISTCQNTRMASFSKKPVK